MFTHINMCVCHNNNLRKETEIGEGIRGDMGRFGGKKGNEKNYVIAF